MSSGYADVNGIKLYHEIYGEGEPLVLIHGGLTTIGEMQGWVQSLAKTRQVIAVEMQGHGRTADTDRPMSFATMGDDIAALLTISTFRKPTWSAIRSAAPARSARRSSIRKRCGGCGDLSPYARSGWYPEAQRGHEPGRRGDWPKT